MWIRPTSPIRDPRECIAALEFFNQQNNFLSLRSVQEVSDHPFWMKFTNPDGSLIPIIKDKHVYPNSQSYQMFFLHVNLKFLLQKMFIKKN